MGTVVRFVGMSAEQAAEITGMLADSTLRAHAIDGGCG
jgi:hypothetical protein